MPNKIVDGDALWRSDKLDQIELPSYRAEYADLQLNKRGLEYEPTIQTGRGLQ